MKKICISKEWTFTCPEQEGKRQIDLPHDYLVELPRDPKAVGEGATGYYTGTTGEYVKYMQFDDAEHVILDVDGAYMCSRVILNGNMMEMHPYGYTPFLVDLTPKMKKNEINKIAITTQCLEPSSRWYSGAGVYRDVFLWTGGAIRIEPRDIFIATQDLNEESAQVSVTIDITADHDAQVVLEATIHSSEGEAIVSEQRTVNAKKGKHREEIVLEVKDPNTWDIDTPYLYKFSANLMRDGKQEDCSEMSFGIRTISANAQDGLLINGKSVKLRGGCIHHEHGGLGAASYPAAERRKVGLLKQAGYNAIRMAHNPPSLALLEVCDEMGMYVMDEAFDMWNTPKNRLDYSLWFKYCWADDIKDMVMRDRNHPCVISYSVGNEIPERINISDGAYWSQTLVKEVKKYDTTKLVTAGVNEIWEKPDPDAPKGYADPYSREGFPEGKGMSDYNWGPRTEAFAAPLDIVGYNYLYTRYERDHEVYPERVMWGSETHALNILHSWNSVIRNSYVLGDFTWTAYDNLGEAGAGRGAWSREGEITGIRPCEYPWRTCYQGDFDLCGYRRPQSYFREMVWKGDCEPRIFTTHPEHFGEKYTGTGWHWYDVHETWTFENEYIGKMVKTDVYTDADEIQFLLNGKDLGKVVPVDGIATMDIPYEKGELTAVSYKNDKMCKKYSLHTVGEAYKVKVVAEKNTLVADNRDLCYLDISIVDDKGDIIPHADCEIVCKVEGAELLTAFSGNPANEDDYLSGKCHVFNGKAIAVIRTDMAGDIRVIAESEGVQSAEIIVKASE